MKITNDFETRSKKKLDLCGAWAYAEHESTEPFCWAFKVDDGPVGIWINPYFALIAEHWLTDRGLFLEDEFRILHDPIPFLNEAIKRGAIFEAHNAEFERAIFHHQMVKKFYWPEVPLEQWRCSAAKAAVHQLPRKLDDAAKALELKNRKDKDGHAVMMRLTKPKNPSKADPGIWDEDPQKLIKTFHYCEQDVETEHELSDNLRDISDPEQQMWIIDQKINQRGVNIDVDSVHSIIRMFETSQVELAEECKSITGVKPTQVEALRTWINDQGVTAKNLQADTVTRLLELDHIPDNVKRVLEIRQQAGMSSIKKYYAMLNSVNEDLRARGCHMFNGAGTGRWSGKRVQFQNIIKAFYDDVEACLKAVKSGDYELVKMLYDKLIVTASKLIRSMIMAPKGKTLMAGDFKAIEGRILAWLAGEEFILDAYRDGSDLYKLAASGAFNKPYDSIDKDLRDIGKVIELACGFQGFWSAFMSMAKKFNVKPPEAIQVEKKDMRDFNGRRLTVREAKFKKWSTPFILEWRNNRPKTTEFWADLQNAAFECIRKPGKTFDVGYLKFGVRQYKGHRFMHIRLPSGRVLNYFDPKIANVEEKTIEEVTIGGKTFEKVVKKKKKQVTYLGAHSKTKKYTRIHTYGGKLAENVTQAVANDILRFAIQNHEKAGYPIIFHVHDEDVTEVDEGYGSLEEFLGIMAQVPPWAKGCPIGVDGWEGKRYKKG